jgi:GNAT superfamily N-acetyltransferase
VSEVDDPDTLAEAEHVMVDGFPFPHHQPWIRGRALPPGVLELPGWRVWLAYREGEPAAAMYTYDDGHATGVYWVATLPDHRGHGLARALMTTAIAARPDQEFTLVATEAARPLYESLGFATVAEATWHTRPPLNR